MMRDQEPPSEEEQSTRKTILVVEDDSAIGAFLVEAISQETLYHPLLVADALQALKVIQDIKPNLFLLDYYLPKMNGIELYDQLRTFKELADVPVILLTTNLNKRQHDIEERNITGLNKPVELDELISTIEQVLGQLSNEQ